MKILQITVFTLILGIACAFAQAPENKVEIAKNSLEPSGKQGSAVATVPETAPEAASKDAASVPAPSIFRRNAPLLRRVGVETGQTVSLSLDDAIRKALQNNNDIEVSKQNVKKAEFSLRGLFGRYDPVFTIILITPTTFSRSAVSSAAAAVPAVSAANSFGSIVV